MKTHQANRRRRWWAQLAFLVVSDDPWSDEPHTSEQLDARFREWHRQEQMIEDLSEAYVDRMGRLLIEILRLEKAVGDMVVGLFEVDDRAMVEDLTAVFVDGSAAGTKLRMLRTALKRFGAINDEFGELLKRADALVELRNKIAHQLPGFDVGGAQVVFDKKETSARTLDQLEHDAAEARYLRGRLSLVVTAAIVQRRDRRLGRGTPPTGRSEKP